MPDGPDKTCVICGQDCAGQPRIKNDKGQYAHKACAAKKQNPAPEPTAFDDDDGLAMGDLLGDLDPTADEPGIRAACPSCGSSLNEGAVVCMSCGHNTQTGKTLKSKVIVQKDPSAAAGVAAKAGGAAILPVLWIIGGSIGGAVGAAIWGAISYYTHFEIGFIAVLVGFLVGVGVHVSSMGRGAGVIAGVVAAVIALASIGVGKYASIHFQVKSFLGETNELMVDAIDINDDWILTSHADDVATERLEGGESIDWPRPEMVAEVAQWPDDYPESIRIAATARFDALSDDQMRQLRERLAQEFSDEWGEEVSYREIDDEWVMGELAMSTVRDRVKNGVALDWPDPLLVVNAASWPDDYPEDIREIAQARFDAMSPEEIDALREGMASARNQVMSTITAAVTEDGFKDSFNLFDVLWLFLAVGAAYGVASNEGISLGD